MADSVEHHDIIIIGAGLSGINTAHLLRDKLPHRQFTILETRDVIAGTWSFFKYPGFRSDSYMSSFGLRWHPWKHRHKMASAGEIVEYLEDAVDTAGLREKIQFKHKVVDLEWRTEEQQWRLAVDAEGERKTFTANFIFSCAGYYSYEKAFETTIPGIKSFRGDVIHPQWWPEDFNYSGKRIVVIGSGATTVTIVPSLAEKAESVTQLQRSPSFVVTRPTTSGIDDFLRKYLPLSWACWLVWWKDTIWEFIITQYLLNYPEPSRIGMSKLARRALPRDINVRVHFNPSYNPFQQRLCMCPDGDYFKAFHRGNVDIVTDVIETVTEDGILLKSGKKLAADTIITATGLHFEVFNGLIPLVDGQPIDPGSHYLWRGCMLDSLPNMGFIMGYVTTSWTPGADLMARTIIRVLKRMERTGSTSVMPVIEVTEDTPCKLAVSATSNYFIKAADRMPKVTDQGPWYGRVNLFVDLWGWLFGSVTDGLLYSTDVNKKDN